VTVHVPCLPLDFVCRAGPSRYGLGGTAGIDFETREA
jgi:hypothetical protein